MATQRRGRARRLARGWQHTRRRQCRPLPTLPATATTAIAVVVLLVWVAAAAAAAAVGRLAARREVYRGSSASWASPPQANRPSPRPSSLRTPRGCASTKTKRARATAGLKWRRPSVHAHAHVHAHIHVPASLRAGRAPARLGAQTSEIGPAPPKEPREAPHIPPVNALKMPSRCHRDAIEMPSRCPRDEDSPHTTDRRDAVEEQLGRLGKDGGARLGCNPTHPDCSPTHHTQPEACSLQPAARSAQRAACRPIVSRRAPHP